VTPLFRESLSPPTKRDSIAVLISGAPSKTLPRSGSTAVVKCSPPKLCSLWCRTFAAFFRRYCHEANLPAFELSPPVHAPPPFLALCFSMPYLRSLSPFYLLSFETRTGRGTYGFAPQLGTSHPSPFKSQIFRGPQGSSYCPRSVPAVSDAVEFVPIGSQ